MDDEPAIRKGETELPEKSVGKFDGSGVSGSTGRGRSQALESKVRIADKNEAAGAADAAARAFD